MIKKLLFLGLLSCGSMNLQAVVAVGDTPDSPTTFQFSVGPVIYNPVGPQLWTLSAQELPYPLYSNTVRSYGVSYTKFIPVDGSLNLTLTAFPYLTSQAIITTTDSQGVINPTGEPVDNPLLGQAFSDVTFVGSALTMVNALAPRYVYMIQAQSVAFYDSASGKYSPEGICVINQLDLGLGQRAKMIAGSGAAVLFVAQVQGATFGTDPSEIAFATTQVTSPQGQNTSYTTLVNQAATGVTVSTPALIAAGNDLQAIGSSVAMYPSPINYQMYLGLDVTAGVASGSQAVGLCTATSVFKTETTPAEVLFGSILPNEVASAGLDTPVSASRGHRVAVRNISSTVTSTGLSYIINSYTNGTGRQFVYAMPMVTMDSTGVNNGKIANFDSIAQVFKISGTTYRTQGFDTVIGDANEIDINSTNLAVIARMQVGGGAVPLPAGQYIEQLMALGDAVYISIQEPFGTDATPGMFKSQALVDAQGRIMSWSPWQRVAGTDDQILFAALNKDTDATMFVSGADSNTVQQTVWNNTTDLTSCIAATNSAMPFSNGGVQGLLTVSNKTPNLLNCPMIVTAGNAGVVITQTGSLDGDGNMVIDSPQNTVTLNNSLGLNIGSVVAATFAHNLGTDDNWFFIGGDSGLSVLSGDTTGYAFNGELLNLDALIAPGMSCKTLGSFSFVKKLVSSDNYLYVLTPSAVYRIALLANKFKLVPSIALNPELVISASTIDRFASCTDMIVDTNILTGETLLLLGTTAGLYSLDLSGALPATPTAIEIPGGLSSVSRLFTISNHPNYYQNFYDSSNLYVLTINYVVQQARLNRFTITNGVVAPIQDQLLQGQNGPLLIFSYMSNNIFIDGSLGFATSYRMGKLAPTIKYLESSLQGGKSSTHVSLQRNTADLSIKAIVNSLGITAVARDYASGCLVLAADFGILTNS